jgi:hypothetical protein
MLIGSFSARYAAPSDIPEDWPEQSLRHGWPSADGTRP